MSRRSPLRSPFVWAAWIGVLTTALNTGLLLSADRAGLDSLRNLVLLVHAPATLLPVIGIALLGFRAAPFAAVVAIVATLLEKSLEFVGQTLLVFPPGGSPASPAATAFAAIWDQLFFVLWSCNTAGAAAAGLLMLRIAPTRFRWPFAAAAWGASLTTAYLILGPDYFGLALPPVPALLFFLLFTGYRVAMALTLSLCGDPLLVPAGPGSDPGAAREA